MQQYLTPNLDIDVVKYKGNGYSEQRKMNYQAFLGITGRFTKEVPDGTTETQWTKEDSKAIFNFSRQTVNTVYRMLDEKQSGTLVCPGFIQFGEFPEVWLDLELVPHQACFRFQLEVQFILSDTEV